MSGKFPAHLPKEIWIVGLSLHRRMWGDKQFPNAITVATWIPKRQECS